MKISKYLVSKNSDMFGYNNTIVQEDIKSMMRTVSSWDRLNDKTVLVAGATGMLATYITYFLCYIHKKPQTICADCCAPGYPAYNAVTVRLRSQQAVLQHFATIFVPHPQVFYRFYIDFPSGMLYNIFNR